MASVMTSLDAVVQKYLQDNDFQQARQEVAEKRRATIPYYNAIINKFIDGTSNLDDFRNDLKTLHQEKFWGASSPGFLMVLNELANNHVPTNPDFEANFRFILRDLNTQNVGQRIEQFHHLLIQEKTRLEASGLSDKRIAAPGSSAFIISLLALWLNYPTELYVCYPVSELDYKPFSMQNCYRRQLIYASIRVSRLHQADYYSVTSVIEVLAASQPALKVGEYWAERFFRWIKNQLMKDPAFLNVPIVLIQTGSGEERRRRMK